MEKDRRKLIVHVRRCIAPRIRTGVDRKTHMLDVQCYQRHGCESRKGLPRHDRRHPPHHLIVAGTLTHTHVKTIVLSF